MKQVLFATSNSEKLLIAETVCALFGIKVNHVSVDIDEIQSEHPEVIVEDKAKRAYQIVNRPIVVSDDSWDIPSLGGFPGPYMKSINHWFKPEDFLQLMANKQNRDIILHQFLTYYDGQNIRTFQNDIGGHIINEPRGINNRSPNMTVIELGPDNGKTIAEVFEQGQEGLESRYKSQTDVWHQFAGWYSDAKLTD